MRRNMVARVKSPVDDDTDMRTKLWRKALVTVELDAQQNTARRESVLTVNVKRYVKKIIIKPYPAHVHPRSPWSKVTSSQLSSFLSTFPNLETLVARNYIEHPRSNGPSLYLPTLKHLRVISPMAVCQSTFAKCFPNLESLYFREEYPNLLLPADQALCRPGCQNCAVGPGYIAKLFGDEMKQLKVLSLNTMLPSEKDQWPSGELKEDSWTAEGSVRAPCGKMPALEVLDIRFPGTTFERDRAYDLRFNLHVRSFNDDAMWTSAHYRGYRVDNNDLRMTDAGQGMRRPPGWLTPEQFTPSTELEEIVGKRMASISTLESFSIEQQIEIGAHTLPGYVEGTGRQKKWRPFIFYQLRAKTKPVWVDGRPSREWVYSEPAYKADTVSYQRDLDLANGALKFGVYMNYRENGLL